MTAPNHAPRNANGDSVERAQFEESLVAMHMATGMPECDARSFLEVGSMGYTSTFTKAAWWAWQASRAAIEVELPDWFDPYGGSGEQAYWRIEVDKAIESLGLKVKA